jgi:hypothetical protein
MPRGRINKSTPSASYRRGAIFVRVSLVDSHPVYRDGSVRYEEGRNEQPQHNRKLDEGAMFCVHEQRYESQWRGCTSGKAS